MKVLITAGSTEVPIDRVRSLGNIFKGKTGAKIAHYFRTFGHQVTLLTSGDPVEFPGRFLAPTKLIQFREYDELAVLMEREVRVGRYDLIIHSAAVSDYKVSQVMTSINDSLLPIDSTKKISSSHDKLYLELTPTIKLVDQVREPWGFEGKLVKFKLEVGISDEDLIQIARKSMLASKANHIVANCLDWAKERAYVIGADGSCENIPRDNLPGHLHQVVR